MLTFSNDSQLLQYPQPRPAQFIQQHYQIASPQLDSQYHPQYLPVNPFFQPRNYGSSNVYSYPNYPPGQHTFSYQQPLNVQSTSSAHLNKLPSGLHPGYTSPDLPNSRDAEVVKSVTYSVSSREPASRHQSVSTSNSTYNDSIQTSPLPQSHYLNKVWRADEPIFEKQKIKLPSISDLTNLNFLNSKFKIKEPSYRPTFKPILKFRQDSKKCQSKKEVKSTGVSKITHYPRLVDKPTPKFFNECRVTENFLLKNLNRDLFSGKFQLNLNVPAQEVNITDDDILRFKIYDFLFDYLNMNDSRVEYQKSKSERNNNTYLNLDEEKKFRVRVSIELQRSKIYKDIGQFQNNDPKDIKYLQVSMLLVKPNVSQLTKDTILKSFQLQFDKFFGGLSLKGSESVSKPKWGLGAKDELSVLELTVDINH